MVLQNLIFRTEGMQETEGLYYHADTELHISEDGMYIPADCNVRFDTYFNSLISKTWLRYSIVEMVCFRFAVDGTGSIRIMGNRTEPFGEQKFFGRQEVIFYIDLKKSPFFYPELHTEKSTNLISGNISAVKMGKDGRYLECRKKKKIKLALVTCTYNRREDITRNVSLLRQRNKAAGEGEPILEQIYVVDNARNLRKSEIEEERISLVPNQNTGGAGGFTRGLKEAMKQESLTHIILMDDDVCMEFEAFYRTKAFLSYVRPEYEENFLGGAMLCRDKPYVLHAAGEDWADGRIRNPYKNTDLREFSHVLHISEPVETKQAYAGWWYCCVPRSHVEQKGFPMPFFLHCDDVEYGLRNGKPPIFLNGVAVWHEEFGDKRVSVMEYYDVRNRLITNAIYKVRQRRSNAEAIILERFLACILRYRYKDIDLIIQAADDFLKGPGWLENLESEKYHKELINMGYKQIPMKGVKVSAEKKDTRKLVTVLGYLFPAHGTITIRVGSLVSSYTGKKEVILIETKKQTGIVVRKSWQETFRCARKIIKCSIRMHFIYKSKAAEWESLAKSKRTKEKKE